MYTWDPKWISQYESPWNIVNKFMIANSLFGTHAAREFTTMKPRSLSDTSKERNLNTGVISNYAFNNSTWCIGNQTIVEYGTKIITELLQPILSNNSIDNRKTIYSSLISKQFRFCPKCMKIGEHKIYHQFTFLDKCLIHKEKLLNRCPNCNNILMYEIIFNKEIRGYQCVNCNYNLFDGHFSEIIDIWKSNNTIKYVVSKPHDSNIFNHLLLYYEFNNKDNSKKINKFLFSLFANKKINLKSEYNISNNIIQCDVLIDSLSNFKNDTKHPLYQYIYQEELSKWSQIYKNKFIEKVYNQSYIEITQKILTDFEISKDKLNNANIYYDLCKTYKHKFDNSILGDFIDKTFDIVALAFWIWKRDMEYYGQNNRFYFIDLSNYNSNHFPIISSDTSIIQYLEYINTLFHAFGINELNITDTEYDNIKYTTMLYISKNIMYKKFTALCCYIKKLSDRYDKYEFLKIFENIPYIEVDISNLVALLIDKETKQFYLYTD